MQIRLTNRIKSICDTDNVSPGPICMECRQFISCALFVVLKKFPFPFFREERDFTIISSICCDKTSGAGLVFPAT